MIPEEILKAVVTGNVDANSECKLATVDIVSFEKTKTNRDGYTL